MKILVKTAVAALLILCIPLSPARAADGVTLLVPVGASVGIRIETDGLLVIGMAAADGISPAWAAGIREGDLITHVGPNRVTTAQELREALSECGEAVAVRFLRDGKEVQVTVKPAPGEEGTPELGVWLRSAISGIGAMTWYDPSDGSFAALGHGVSDPDTGILLPLRQGFIGRGAVEAITKGTPGTPGEVRGSLGLEAPCGVISLNGETGIFGQMTTGIPELPTDAPIPVCPEDEIRCGDAEIYSDVSGQREKYSARILRVYKDDGCRDLLLQITDPRLIELTGGIVQGMSGSPIVQNGRLVGAVTHVLVSDPLKGYGISAEAMLRAEKELSEAA